MLAYMRHTVPAPAPATAPAFLRIYLSCLWHTLFSLHTWQVFAHALALCFTAGTSSTGTGGPNSRLFTLHAASPSSSYACSDHHIQIFPDAVRCTRPHMAVPTCGRMHSASAGSFIARRRCPSRKQHRVAKTMRCKDVQQLRSCKEHSGGHSRQLSPKSQLEAV